MIKNNGSSLDRTSNLNAKESPQNYAIMMNDKEYYSVQPKTMDEVNQRAEAMDTEGLESRNFDRPSHQML